MNRFKDTICIINGYGVSKPKDTKYILSETPYAHNLHNIMGRLERDIGFLLGVLDTRIKTGPNLPGIGFFTVVRALMPIVESIAVSQGRDPIDLLINLDVPAPAAAWGIYRNMLLHTDEFISIKVGSFDYLSGISISGGEDNDDIHANVHATGANYRFLNVRKLYDDLLKHIESEIEATMRNDRNRKTTIIVGIKYKSSSKRKKVARVVAEVKQASRS